MGNIRHDRIIAYDLELTCYAPGEAPDGFVPEIIEFGLAEIDVEAQAIRRSNHILVRPVRTEVTPFCTQLTGISKELLDREGIRLPDALARLRKDWGVGSKALVTWGDDRTAIRRDCSLYRGKTFPHGCADPFSETVLDIGTLFTLMAGSKSSIGLLEAAGLLGLETERPQHRAEADSVTTAEVWIALANRMALRFDPDQSLNHPIF